MLSSGGLGVERRGRRGVVDQWLMEAKQAAARGTSVVQEVAFRGRTVTLTAVSPISPAPNPSLHLKTHSKKEGRVGGRERGDKIKTLFLFLSLSGAGWVRVGRDGEEIVVHFLTNRVKRTLSRALRKQMVVFITGGHADGLIGRGV